ncbi:MAG TPA: hypothetical protein VGD39_12270 [Nocardioides sp.]
MTNHRERARQIVANYAPDSLQAALVHAVLDLADAIREGHAPAEAPTDSHSDVEDLVVVTVQQQPDRKAIVYSGAMGTYPVTPEDADLIVLVTPSSQGGMGLMDLLIYANQDYNQLVGRVRGAAGVRRNLITRDDGTTVTMTRALADEVVTKP